jgi:hypothetical protein
LTAVLTDVALVGGCAQLYEACVTWRRYGCCWRALTLPSTRLTRCEGGEGLVEREGREGGLGYTLQCCGGGWLTSQSP